MTLTETHCTDPARILDVIDHGVQAIQQEGGEPRYIVVGKEVYPQLCEAISARFNRGEGNFETYQWLPIILDPARTDEILVLPSPQVLKDGVRVEVLDLG